MAYDPDQLTDEEIHERGVDEEFAFDDSAYDVAGWVSVEVGGLSVAEIHIDDLYPAALAYKERYQQQLERDKQ